MSERRRRAEGGRGTLRRARSRAGIQACGAGTSHNQSGASRSKTPAELTHRRGKRGRLRNRGRLLWTPLTQPGESAPPVEELVDDPRLGKRRRFLSATVPVVAAVETPAASDLCTDAPEGAPPRRGTQRRTRHRRMTTVSSTSSFRRRRRRRRGRLLGVKPQAEAPHSAPVASRGAMRRRHRRRTCRARVHSAPSIRAAACARARGIRPWSAAVRARTGLAWSPSSSPPQRERVKARGERRASVDGK